MDGFIIGFAFIASLFIWWLAGKYFRRKGKRLNLSILISFPISIISFFGLIIILLLVLQPDSFTKYQAIKPPVAGIESEHKNSEKGNKTGLGFTDDQFLVNLEEFSKKFDLSIKISRGKDIFEGENKITKVDLSKFVSMVITSDKTSNKISDIMVIGISDGTLLSGANIIINFGAVIAATNPNFSRSDRGELMREIGMISDHEIHDGSAVRNNILYEFTSTSMGNFLTINSV